MRKTLGICVVVAVCVTSTGASAFGINDILIPAFQLGVKAMGNAASNLATSAYEAATGKKSREEVQAEQKAFLEDAYDRLDKNCPQIDRNRLGPAKAVMTDVYEYTFADEFAKAHDRKRKSLLTWGDVGEAVMSSPTVQMKTAEIQAKAYKAGVGTIGGRTKWETARIMDAAEAAAKGRPVAYVPPSAGPSEMAMTLLGQTAGQADDSAEKAQDALPSYFRDAILQEACVREQLGRYLEAVRTRDLARQTKRQEAEQQGAKEDGAWPAGGDTSW